jgi:hypothetical protein
MEQMKKLEFLPTWAAFKKEGPAFWMISLYILMEYIRPQGIYPWIDIFPWTQTFLILALAFHFGLDRGKFSKDAYTFWLLLFLGVAVVSSFGAYRSDIAFGNLPEMYSWIVIYFVVSSVVNNEKRLWMFTLLFFLACAKMSLFCANVWVTRGFSFAAWGVSGPPGYFQNSGELSLLMCMFFAMSYTFWRAIAKDLTRWRSWVMLSLPITAVMTVIASSSRGSQLGLLVQLLYLAFVFKKLSFRNLVFIVLVGYAIYAVFPAEQLDRFSTAGTDETSVARLTYWKKGWEMLQEHPFFGVGHGNFARYFQDFYGQFSVFHRAEVAHNFVVQVASELGYTGIIVFLIIILRSFKVTADSRRRLRLNKQEDHWIYAFCIGLDCAMIGYIIGGQFMAVAYYPYVWIHISFVAAANAVARQLTAPDTGATKPVQQRRTVKPTPAKPTPA